MGALVVGLLVGLAVIAASSKAKARAVGEIFPGVPNEIAFEAFGLVDLTRELCGESGELDRIGQIFALGAPNDPGGALERLRSSLATLCPAALSVTAAELTARGEQVLVDQGAL